MLKLLLFFGTSVFVLAVVIIALLLWMSPSQNNTSVLSMHSPLPSVIPTTLPTLIQSGPTAIQTPTGEPTPTGVVKKTSKKKYSIAIFGDSLVDTMGERLEYLDKQLHNIYPQTQFDLYNYGIGGQNVSVGLERFSSSFNYKTRQYPSIVDLHPDIIVLGSFAYNPFDPHDRNKHYSQLIDLVHKAQAVTTHVYLLKEIAPKKIGFGKGPHGVNWPDDQSYTHALHIIEQLEDVTNVSNALHVPIINVYKTSTVDGTFGSSAYVNSDDGIHPSVAGHILTAQIIAKTLVLK
jgi:hypothetical protein